MKFNYYFYKNFKATFQSELHLNFGSRLAYYPHGFEEDFRILFELDFICYNLIKSLIAGFLFERTQDSDRSEIKTREYYGKRRHSTFTSIFFGYERRKENRPRPRALAYVL